MCLPNLRCGLWNETAITDVPKAAAPGVSLQNDGRRTCLGTCHRRPATLSERRNGLFLVEQSPGRVPAPAPLQHKPGLRVWSATSVCRSTAGKWLIDFTSGGPAEPPRFSEAHQRVEPLCPTPALRCKMWETTHRNHRDLWPLVFFHGSSIHRSIARRTDPKYIDRCVFVDTFRALCFKKLSLEKQIGGERRHVISP